MRLKNRTVASDMYVVEGLSDCSTGASAGFPQALTIQVTAKSTYATTKSVELHPLLTRKVMGRRVTRTHRGEVGLGLRD